MFATWNWSNFLQKSPLDAKPVLCVNMDETSIRLFPEARKGWVIADSSSERRSLLRRGPGLSLNERRACVTLVSFLADSEEAQASLPQVFVINEHTLTAGEVDELNVEAADNVFFIRRPSAWVNSKLLVQILDVLADRLKEVSSSYRIVLCMDTYRAHLHVSICQACSRHGFFLMYIPASMTAWLQPLDLVVFKRYKDWVASRLEQERLTAPSGSLSRVAVLLVYEQGIHAVIEGQLWRRAFDLAGLGDQSSVSQELLKRLGLAGAPAVSADLPTAADLLAVYPRRANIPVDELFDLVLRRSMPSSRPVVLPSRARLTSKRALPPPLQPAASSM